MNDLRVGLVLSGGGAKGAYQVGVVKALAELGTRIDAVAGASIGALNGAVLASATSLSDGAARMEELWCALAAEPPLKLNLSALTKLLIASGMTLSPAGGFALAVAALAARAGLDEPTELLRDLDEGVYSSGPLRYLMQRYLDPQALQDGLPLYLSAFETRGGLIDLLDWASAQSGLRDTKPSTFFHVQSLPPSQQRDALLASAALPILFAPRQIGGKAYSDGGLGGTAKSQGNTPITPLLQAGVRTIIVTHLVDGSLWSRHDFPDATIIEIRPQRAIERDGSNSDLLGFDQRRIPSWIVQGYEDALACLRRVAGASIARAELAQSERRLEASDAGLPALDARLDDAMARLRKSGGRGEREE